MDIPELPPPVNVNLLQRVIPAAVGPYIGRLVARFFARRGDVPSGWIELVDNEDAERVYIHQRNLSMKMREGMLLKFRARRNADGRMDAEDVTVLDNSESEEDNNPPDYTPLVVKIEKS